MTTNRPTAADIQGWLDGVIKLYPAARHLATGQAGSSAMGDYTTGGEFSDLSGVINVALSRMLDELDSEVYAYARMLDEADRTPPADQSTVGLVRWLRLHIGYFTHGDDAQLAYAFEADAEAWHHRLETAADPGGRVALDTGEACQEEGCDGTYKVSIDRDKPLPYDLAAHALRRKDARCSKDREHVILVEMLPMVRRWVSRL